MTKKEAIEILKSKNRCYGNCDSTCGLYELKEYYCKRELALIIVLRALETQKKGGIQ